MTGFLEKSKDTLYSDIIMGLQSSSLSVVSQLFPMEEERTAKRPVTVATQFKVNKKAKLVVNKSQTFFIFLKIFWSLCTVNKSQT